MNWYIHLLPKAGYQWMPKGTQVEVMTPGKNEKHYLAGGWDIRTGKVHYCFAARRTNQLFRNLLRNTLEIRYPARWYDRVYIVADNYRIHHAQPVQAWLAALIRASRCSGCRPTAREPIRSSASSVTRMTKSHGTTNGNDYATWRPTWSVIWSTTVLEP